MKKKFKKLTKVFTILVVFMMLTNCVNENLDLPNQDASIGNAKKWFDLNKLSLVVLDHTQTIDWANAIVSNGDKGTIVEVPLILKGNITAKVGEDQSYKTYNRIMFISDKQETYKAYHVLITTNDMAFDNNSKNCNFYKLSDNFNGYITVINVKKEITDFNTLLSKDIFVTKTSKTGKLANMPVTCVYYGEFDGLGDFRPMFLVGCYGGGGGINDGGTGYGGGGGGAGGGGSVLPDPNKTPCSAGATTTTISQNSNYTSATASILKASADGKEHSITLGRNANGQITQAPMNNGSLNIVNTNTSWPGAFADIHNHITDGPPSSNDIVYAAVQKNVMHNGYTTSFINVPQGSYAVVVNDLAAAQRFVAAYPADILPPYPPEFPDFIFNQIDGLKKQLGESVEGKMEAVSFILDKYASGITILKQDSDGNYKPFIMNETVNPDGTKTYTLIPCNN